MKSKSNHTIRVTPKKKRKAVKRKQQETKLDKTLEATFPASDATAEY